MNLLKRDRPFFQLLPLFRGKLRASRFFYHGKESLSKPCSFKIKNDLEIAVPSLIDSIGYELFINGIYEHKTIDFLHKHIPKGGVFVDVGANIGAISVLIAKRRPDITIYAFEASPFIFSFLDENIQNNRLKNVFAFNHAVHDEDGKEMNFYAPEDEFGKGSFSQTYSNKAELVSTVRLDTFFDSHAILPDIIKVDVQGYEFFVFNGMSGYIEQKKKKPIILFEFEGWAESIAMGKENIGKAKDCLQSYGYRFVPVGSSLKHVPDGIDFNNSELVALPV
ncbi:FkbM family methyltransferase [Lacibacter sp. H375]|uniref:FkbM family methyltransferase n=1 Tax=Lacibacter sp. H375 TaxID=3133424 RepID=UPI0030C14A81